MNLHSPLSTLILHLLICKMEILIHASIGLFCEVKVILMMKTQREERRHPPGEETPGGYAEGGLGEGGWIVLA